eukprot:COSAG01_NODE_10393_length_2177_cov_2.759865_2_plen_112_part_00
MADTIGMSSPSGITTGLALPLYTCSTRNRLQQGPRHMLFGAKGRSLTPIQLITRMAGVWKRLDFDRRGANGARHACVAASCKRRKLTREERAIRRLQRLRLRRTDCRRGVE